MCYPTSVRSQGTIILLVDMSYSINDEEAQFQMDSYANVLGSMSGFRNHDFEIIVYGETANYVVKHGTYNDAINYFSGWERKLNGSTCLHNPLNIVIANFDKYSKPVIIDITGDGEHNCNELGPIQNGVSTEKIHSMLDYLEYNGAQINTLYIGNKYNKDKTEQENFEKFSLMSRGGGFSLKTKDYMEFEFALYEKLALEIAYLKEYIK